MLCLNIFCLSLFKLLILCLDQTMFVHPLILLNKSCFWILKQFRFSPTFSQLFLLHFVFNLPPLNPFLLVLYDYLGKFPFWNFTISLRCRVKPLHVLILFKFFKGFWCVKVIIDFVIYYILAYKFYAFLHSLCEYIASNG